MLISQLVSWTARAQTDGGAALLFGVLPSWRRPSLRSSVGARPTPLFCIALLLQFSQVWPCCGVSCGVCVWCLCAVVLPHACAGCLGALNHSLPAFL